MHEDAAQQEEEEDVGNIVGVSGGSESGQRLAFHPARRLLHCSPAVVESVCRLCGERSDLVHVVVHVVAELVSGPPGC